MLPYTNQPSPMQQVQQIQQRQQQKQQSFASYFNLLNLVENLAEVTENGSRDLHSDALVNELTAQFDKCQQFLNTIASNINIKSVTVEGQKKKLEETEQIMNQRRDMMMKYQNYVEKQNSSSNSIVHTHSTSN
ncbi:hypothetical protein ZOSMA_14G01170 [Zostera marina]|uniref:Mediator of RNA polymerase II transcription subunit 9 n=1 Tax=Zostera marina TaxID=29655 RepID=A0A0K9PWE4_ZOSMR|nr:hypothetical protein ZOSMA_14G01170 [Zostera marina]